MDNSFHRQETDTQRSPGFQIINSILNWLADLIKLTDDERMDAGIYLGDERNKLPGCMIDLLIQQYG